MEKISKREFLKQGFLCSGGLICTSWLGAGFTGADNAPDKWSREAMFSTPTPRGVRCELCPNYCNLKPGEFGDCRSRINHEGKLYSIAYGNPCSVHVDPIEKKPLLHFHPESMVLSIAAAGCNFACLNCQNWEISQTSPRRTKNYDLFPEKVVSLSRDKSCPSIAYTYSEPMTFYEYMYETSRLARQEKINNVVVSNGYINREPLEKLAPFIDAANIDLKSFSNDIYLRLSSGQLQPVLDTLKILREHKVWLEITNLVVPSWTDDFDMISRMCEWLAVNGFTDTPLHFSRFHPSYKLTQLPETPVSTLSRAREIAMKAGIRYVYVGNVPGKGFEDTECPKCHKTIIKRKGYALLEYQLEGNKCKYCHTVISGVWN